MAECQVLPASHVVEDRVAGLGRTRLVEDIKGFQGFELLFLVDLVPKGHRVQSTKLKIHNNFHFIHSVNNLGLVQTCILTQTN